MFYNMPGFILYRVTVVSQLSYYSTVSVTSPGHPRVVSGECHHLVCIVSFNLNFVEDLLRDEQKPEPVWQPERGATRIKILDESKNEGTQSKKCDCFCCLLVVKDFHLVV